MLDLIKFDCRIDSHVGGFLVVDWLGTLVTAFVGMFLGLVVVRNVLASYLLGPWLLVPWLWLRTGDWAYVAYGLAANVLFVLAMIPEIRTIRDRKRRGVQGDFAASMESTPMGAMIKKMGMRIGLFQDN